MIQGFVKPANVCHAWAAEPPADVAKYASTPANAAYRLHDL